MTACAGKRRAQRLHAGKQIQYNFWTFLVVPSTGKKMSSESGDDSSDEEHDCDNLIMELNQSVARAAWVQDYGSNHGCGETVEAELCDPGEPMANRACQDACHYNGCSGGWCVYLGDGGGGGGGRGCHCRR
ncbi:hypothetical protein GUJ93_ZPchr0013g34512 [Zizania palustris]|uniref:Uncharacterized protein n=1 Tax=Zizania palustris TaxID=103762 RepID=A0A8J5X5V3_ZIZPA|nr:hypothetical protein GUJ93_ZPchr0013g34512 [Zizania palustris]